MRIIVPKYGNVLFPSSGCLISLSFVAYFRSTTISFEKWNKKCNNSSDSKGPKPSKTYFKFKTQQKRNSTFDEDYLRKRRAIRWDADSIDFTNNRNRRDTFKSWEESSSQSQTNGSDNRNSKFRTESDEESDDVDDDDDDDDDDGLHSDRIALGLPINGPLTFEEVKDAFRISALKWHPDKHQGPSQAVAEEKFKDCLNAYKSLFNALSKD